MQIHCGQYTVSEEVGKMKVIKDSSGSALVWVLVICIIFAILGMAIGWVALSMNNRSINNNIQQQTYFTARSAVDAVYNQLGGEIKEDEDSFSKYLSEHLLSNECSIYIDNMGFNENMGVCSLKGSYDQKEKVVTLSGTAHKGSMEDTVVLTVKMETTAKENIWPNESLGTKLNSKNDKKLVNNIGKDNFIYCLGESNEDVDKLDFFPENKNKAIFIYIKQGKTLTINEMKNWEDSSPDVFVYLEKDATLYFDLKNNDSTIFPLYINGYTGSTIKINPENKNVTVYGLSGATVTEGRVNVDESKKIPPSGYGPTGVPATGEESGVKTDKWTKIQYTSGN